MVDRGIKGDEEISVDLGDLVARGLLNGLSLGYSSAW
jgi:hypothetical protein